MEFAWDEAKNLENIRKHGVKFADAEKIFEGAVLTYPDQRFDYGEERWISIGAAGPFVFLVVAHTDRNGVTRIISARRATKRERERYLVEIHF